MIKYTAFTESYTANPFWYQQFGFIQITTLRGGQPLVEFDVADNFPSYVTTKEAMDFQNDIAIVKFNDHYILVFDLTSMQMLPKLIIALNYLENHQDWS